MSSSRIVRTMLEYGVNEATIRRAVDSTRRVNSALNEVIASGRRTGVATLEASQGFARMASAEDRARASTVKLSQVLTDAQRQARKLNEEMSRAPGAGGGGRGALGALGGGRNTVERLGSSIVGLPAVGHSTDIGQGLRALGAVGVGVSQLTGVAAIAGPALVATAIAFHRFNEEIAIYKQALEATLRAQRTLSQARTEANSAEVRESLSAATRRRDALQGDVDAAQQRLEGAFADVSANFGDLGARLTDNVTPVAQLREEYEALRGQYLEQSALVSGYTGDLEANAYALQDLILLQQQAAEQTARIVNVDLQERLAARTLTTEAATDRIAALEYERATLDDLISTGSATGEQLTQFRARLDDISQALFILNTLSLPLIAAREREEAAAQNLTDRIDMATEALEEQAKAEEKLGEIAADILKAGADSAQKLAQIAADLSDKIAEAAHDRDAALAEAERDAGIAREEAVRENNEALEEAEVDHRERLEKIQRDFNKDFENAVGNRDALAAANAQQTRKEQTEDEKRDYDKRRKEINKRLSETNRDIERKLAEQSRTVRMRYEEQLRTAQIAAQRAVQIENARAAAQIAALQATFNAQQAIVADWAQKVINYTYAVSNAVNGLLGGKSGVTTKPVSNFGTLNLGTKASVTSNFVPTGGYVGAGGGAIGGYGGGIGFGGFYASGGTPPVGRRVLVGEHGPELATFNEPARIYNHMETKRMMSGGGGINISIAGVPMTRNALRRAVDKRLNETLIAKGVPA